MMSARYRQTKGTEAALSCSNGSVLSIALLILEGVTGVDVIVDVCSDIRKSLCQARDSLLQFAMLLSKTRVHLITHYVWMDGWMNEWMNG